MSEKTFQLLETFDSLPPEEQHEVLAELLKRSRELPSTILADEELVGLADDLFQSLDAEEANGSKSSET